MSSLWDCEKCGYNHYESASECKNCGTQRRLPSVAHIACMRCKKSYPIDSIEYKCFTDDCCHVCREELGRKFAEGQSNALDDLVAAARDLRQASADYTNGSEKGEIHYADAIHESVDLLIDALNSYEGGGKK